MNKIFKVLWSKTRNSHVVTNEAMRAHGKGRQGVSCVCDAGALTAIGAAAVLAVSGIPQALAASSTIKPGWTHTQVTTNGNVHNVTTDKIQNGIGINKFVNFNLVAKEIANLKFGDASKLLNFVDSHITVDGVVNAVKDNKIGGDLYFGLNDDGTAEGLSKKDVDRISRSLHAFCAEETEPVMLDLISTKALSAGVGSYLLHANVLPGKDRPMRSRDNDTRAAPTSGTARPRSRPLKKKFAT